MKTLRSICFFALCIWSFVGTVLAPCAYSQNDGYLSESNTRGLAPANSFMHSDIDSINLANGGLNLHIPLVDRKGRGLNESLLLIYSSKIWTLQPVWDGIVPGVLDSLQWQPSLQGGIAYPQPHLAIHSTGAGLTYNSVEYDCTYTYPYFPYQQVQAYDIVDSGFIYFTADGAAYQFPNRLLMSSPFPGQPKCVKTHSLPTPGYSDNGAFMLDSSTEAFNVYFKDGRKDNDGELFDTNGNYMYWNIDTLKRQVTFNGPTWSVHDSNGNSQSYTLQGSGTQSGPTNFPSTTDSCNSGVPVIQWANSGPTSSTLTLPDGLTYGFTYDSVFGEVTKVTLPTGGYIRYTYTTLQAFDRGQQIFGCWLSVDSRRVSGRFVSPDGNAQHEQQWQYAYSLSGGVYKTTVTDPLGNVTVHSFDSAADANRMHETQTQYYDNANHLLRSVSNSWQANSAAPVATGPTGLTQCDYGNWRLISTTTTLADTNQVRQVQNTYDTYTEGSFTPCGTTVSRDLPPRSAHVIIRRLRFGFSRRQA